MCLDVWDQVKKKCGRSYANVGTQLRWLRSEKRNILGRAQWNEIRTEVYWTRTTNMPQQNRPMLARMETTTHTTIAVCEDKICTSDLCSRYKRTQIRHFNANSIQSPPLSDKNKRTQFKKKSFTGTKMFSPNKFVICHDYFNPRPEQNEDMFLQLNRE